MSVFFKFLLVKLITQKFISNVFIHIAEHLATKSDNKIDDKIVKEIKDALEVK